MNFDMIEVEQKLMNFGIISYYWDRFIGIEVKVVIIFQGNIVVFGFVFGVKFLGFVNYQVIYMLIFI